MGDEVTLFESEEKKSREEVCAFLRVLADRLESGRLTFGEGEGAIALDLPGQLVLEIEVEEEETERGIQRSLEIELVWSEAARQGKEGESGSGREAGAESVSVSGDGRLDGGAPGP
jgi:amphi-Trp domain-containing protein